MLRRPSRRFASSILVHAIPKLDGFYMPAEWEQHSGVFMLWPSNTENWKDGAKPARKAFTEVIRAISKFENVTLGVSPDAWDSANESVGSVRSVSLKTMNYDDVWIRDTGPTFLINKKKELGGVDWKFNCYGKAGGHLLGIEYTVPHDRDKLIAKEVLELSNASAVYDSGDFVLEGGSIHVDGEGTIITTEECLLNPNRNPNLSKSSIEKHLSDYIGAEKIIWLPKGLVGDSDTNGHIDNLCCFIAPGTVLLSWCEDPADEQYHISRAALSVLASETDSKGRKLRIHKIPIPPPMYYEEDDCSSLSLIKGIAPQRTPGGRLAASYLNFYLPNGALQYSTILQT
jgi:agmatine deiminase